MIDLSGHVYAEICLASTLERIPTHAFRWPPSNFSSIKVRTTNRIPLISDIVESDDQ